MSGLGAETVHMGHIIISHAGAYVRYGENALWRKWRVYVLWRKWKEKEEEKRNGGNYNRTKVTGKKERKKEKQKESKKKSRKEQQKKKATRKKILEKSKRIYSQPLEYLF